MTTRSGSASASASTRSTWSALRASRVGQVTISTSCRSSNVPKLALRAVLTAAGAVCGCASRAGAAPRAITPDEVRIGVGQSLTRGGLEIRFDSVASDSRCPKGETCVWEGDANVVLAVHEQGEPATPLELHTSAKGPAESTHRGWTMRLVSLEPYPRTGRAMDPAAYVATLMIARSPHADPAP